MSRRSVSFFLLVVLFSFPLRSFAQELVQVDLVRESVSARDCQTLPANIRTGGAGRELVLRVAEMSETFRRQCAAVGRARHIQVFVQMVGRLNASGARAITEIWRDSRNEVRAMIQVPVSRDSAELLAHEFEHVVEQLDGVRLWALLRDGDPTVSQGPGGSFETFRARDAGRKVAAEVDATSRMRRQEKLMSMAIAGQPWLP